ncbi:hypothetical protein, partial [Streptomyces avidinii]
MVLEARIVVTTALPIALPVEREIELMPLAMPLVVRNAGHDHGGHGGVAEAHGRADDESGTDHRQAVPVVQDEPGEADRAERGGQTSAVRGPRCRTIWPPTG